MNDNTTSQPAKPTQDVVAHASGSPKQPESRVPSAVEPHPGDPPPPPPRQRGVWGWSIMNKPIYLGGAGLDDAKGEEDDDDEDHEEDDDEEVHDEDEEDGQPANGDDYSDDEMTDVEATPSPPAPPSAPEAALSKSQQPSSAPREYLPHSKRSNLEPTDRNARGAAPRSSSTTASTRSSLCKHTDWCDCPMHAGFDKEVRIPHLGEWALNAWSNAAPVSYVRSTRDPQAADDSK